MKKSQVSSLRDLAPFEKLLSDRLDTLDRRVGTGNSEFHTGTERLLIHLAFDRIRKNEYWRCVKCGEDITADRMLADPTTLTCSGCEAGTRK